MKRLYLLLLFVMVTFSINAQGIYTKVTKYDKFDDVEWEKDIKTLITKSDTTFVFETKGSEPVTYKLLDPKLFSMHEGNRDSLANIVADIWGYESIYLGVSEKEIKDAYDSVQEMIKEKTDSEVSLEDITRLTGLEIIKKIDKLPTITVRTISKFRYSFEYDTDIIWIKFEDGSRIIYSKR